MKRLNMIAKQDLKPFGAIALERSNIVNGYQVSQQSQHGLGMNYVRQLLIVMKKQSAGIVV